MLWHLLLLTTQPCFSEMPRLDGLSFVTVEGQEEMEVIASAYTADPLQTDSDYCHTASGLNICTTPTPKIVACNFLPLGSKIEINGEVWTVEDRMSSRYGQGFIDLLFSNYDEAIQFGRRKLIIKIL